MLTSSLVDFLNDIISSMRSSTLVVALAAFLAFTQLATALYTPGKTKIDLSLTKENFASQVLDSDSVYAPLRFFSKRATSKLPFLTTPSFFLYAVLFSWLIEFYATWCTNIIIFNSRR